MRPRVGVLSLQGDFAEHLELLQQLDCDPVPVKTAPAISACDALVIPGGESTTIGKLIERFELTPAIQQLHQAGKPILGTCAGVILLAKEIVGSQQFRLGFMDVEVERNAYGRQVDSFETILTVRGIAGDPVRAVFIRAPVIRRVWGSCEVLAEFADSPVLVRQQNLLGATFHPELSGDTRIHELLLADCRQ